MIGDDEKLQIKVLQTIIEKLKDQACPERIMALQIYGEILEAKSETRS